MSKRVLLVDDSLTAAKQLAHIIERIAGFEVVGEGRNGAEALKLFNTLSPDLVCMDIVMPVMDGLQAARAILQADPTATIVMVTSLGGVGDKAAEALRIGAKNVISKPFEPAQIETTFRQLWSGAGD